MGSDLSLLCPTSCPVFLSDCWPCSLIATSIPLPYAEATAFHSLLHQLQDGRNSNPHNKCLIPDHLQWFCFPDQTQTGTVLNKCYFVSSIRLGASQAGTRSLSSVFIPVTSREAVSSFRGFAEQKGFESSLWKISQYLL